MVFLGLVAAAPLRRSRQAGFAVDVTFIAPENSCDAKSRRDGFSSRTRDAILAQLKEHLVTTAAQYLAPGPTAGNQGDGMWTSRVISRPQARANSTIPHRKEYLSPAATLEFRCWGPTARCE